MIGDRIRQARLAAGLTQDELVVKLEKIGRKITKGGLSKYENNGSCPDASFLFALGSVFGVSAQFFLSEPALSIDWLGFRKNTKLRKRDQERIKSRVISEIENYVWLQNILVPDIKIKPENPIKVGNFEDVEKAADKLRQLWDLGYAPIYNLANTLEDKGCIIIEIGGIGSSFDGLSGWVNKKIPVIIINKDVSKDRMRFNLAHEIGHLFLKFSTDEIDKTEKYAHRFAGAFLVPSVMARYELGAKRRSINVRELGLLKQAYGLSMQAWACRAFDLGIIRKSMLKQLFMTFGKNKWRKIEPVDYYGIESAIKFKQMVIRALEEKIISEVKAKRICPDCFIEWTQQETSLSRNLLSDLLKMPVGERDAILRKAAEQASKDYLEDTELRIPSLIGEDIND